MGNGHLVLSQFVDGDEVGVDALTHTHTHTHTYVITMGNGHLVLSQFVDGDEVGVDALTHTHTHTYEPWATATSCSPNLWMVTRWV